MTLGPAAMGTDHGSWVNELVNVVQAEALSRVFGGFFVFLIDRLVQFVLCQDRDEFTDIKRHDLVISGDRVGTTSSRQSASMTISSRSVASKLHSTRIGPCFVGICAWTHSVAFNSGLK
jgi:hypothetical protein